MAINISSVQATVTDSLKAAMDGAYGGGEEKYAEFAGIISDAVVVGILDEIKDNADLTGVTEGGDTVAGGVD